MTDWQNTGFTPIPNIAINNPALPRCVRSTYEAISARAFGKRFSIFVSEEILASDVGVSRITIIRHLNLLEAIGLIKRIRPGRGMTNTIVLTLKMGMSNNKTLSQGIRGELPGLSNLVLKREKLTMKEGLALIALKKRRQKEARHKDS